MKKFCLFGVVVSTLLSSTLLAVPVEPSDMGNRPEMRNHENSKMDAEAQKLQEETRQRRREIMSMIQKYKSATEEEQLVIKAELIKKMSEDYALNLKTRKEAIEKIEKKIAEMSEKDDEKAKTSDQLIEEEFERLVNNNRRNGERVMQRGERGEMPEGDRPMMQRGERGEMPEGDRPMMQRGERGEGMNELKMEEGLVELPTMDENTIKENRERRSVIISKASEYRNAPEEAKDALKAEVIKLLNDDFEINTKNRKEMISKTKENIAKVKNDIAEDEANSTTVVENEFEKLIKMDFSRRDRNQNGGRSQRR